MREDFRFLSKDGKTWIHAVRWTPDKGEIRAVVQLTHGMVEHIGRYERFAQYLNTKGLLVVGHDHLGHGKSITSKTEYGYFAKNNPSDTLVADMHQLRILTQQQYAELPYFMIGHSMGSYMLRKYILMYPEKLSGAVILGTGWIPKYITSFGKLVVKLFSYVHGWHYRSKLVCALSQGKPYHQFDLTGEDPSRSWLTKDVEEVNKYKDAPECSFIFTLNGYRGLFEAVEYSCEQKNVNKIDKNLPILILSGEDDPVGDMGEGVKKAYYMYKKAGVRDLQGHLYPNDRHELLNETDRDKVSRDIWKWIKKHME